MIDAERRQILRRYHFGSAPTEKYTKYEAVIKLLRTELLSQLHALDQLLKLNLPKDTRAALAKRRAEIDKVLESTFHGGLHQ